MEQLEGQIASAKIAMARLSSRQLYYVLSGNLPLTLIIYVIRKLFQWEQSSENTDIRGSAFPFCQPADQLVNQKGKLKSSLIFDEFPTLYLNNMDSLIATARSNSGSTCLGVQDFSQLRKDYGREQADVILNITGNIISGQVTGDTARQLPDRFGKIMQEYQIIAIEIF